MTTRERNKNLRIARQVRSQKARERRRWRETAERVEAYVRRTFPGPVDEVKVFPRTGGGYLAEVWQGNRATVCGVEL